MNSHFQSSATTSTSSGLAFAAIGVRGSRSWLLIQLTEAKRVTINTGIAQLTKSIRPSYVSSSLRLARELEDLYHNDHPTLARITGTTMTSMISVALVSRSSCADAIGPCGSRMPCCPQEASTAA